MSELRKAVEDAVKCASGNYEHGCGYMLGMQTFSNLKDALEKPPIDTSRFDKPFGELSKDEKLALCEAVIDGSAREALTSGMGWRLVSPSVDFMPDITYRTKPAIELVDGDWYAVNLDGRKYVVQYQAGSDEPHFYIGGLCYPSASPQIKLIKHLGNPFEVDHD